MASAYKVPAVTETKVIEVEPEKYILELTPDEAKHLRAMMGSTGDRGDEGFYEMACSVSKTLLDAGVPWQMMATTVYAKWPESNY